MKFLCDNCKAKYQIADEKVAGKTVRMKCRKCGHQIEVRAAVTETSVSTALPGAPPTPPKAGLATSFSAAKPRAPSSPAAPSPSALGSAFVHNVQESPSSAPNPLTKGTPIELSVTDEWYVAINGVPVGPVRISELRRKAAAGAVTEESLCWQEGLEEWRPIKSIPDLAALVREAALGNRPSLVAAHEQAAPPPPPAPTMAAPQPPRAPSAPRQPVAPVAPSTVRHTPPPPRPFAAPQPPAGPRNNVVPLRPAAASSPFDDMVARNQSYPDAGGAAPAFSLTPAPPAPIFAPPQTQQPLSQPMVPIAPVVDPFAVPPPAPIPSPLGPMSPSYPDMRPPTGSIPPPAAHVPQAQAPVYVESKRSVPLWFWPILVLALGFGGSVAFLTFRQQAPQPVVIQMPATATTTQPEEPRDVPPPTSAEPSTPDPVTPKPKTAAKGVAKPATTTEEKKGLDLGNLVPGSEKGPSAGGPSGAGAGGAGLDQAGIERVVANHRAGVKRTCWERGGADQKSSVNVTVTANVAANGTVSSTSHTGDDPVVGKCIENQVRTWTFPAPGSPTTVNIPFKFVRQ